MCCCYHKLWQCVKCVIVSLCVCVYTYMYVRMFLTEKECKAMDSVHMAPYYIATRNRLSNGLMYEILLLKCVNWIQVALRTTYVCRGGNYSWSLDIFRPFLIKFQHTIQYKSLINLSVQAILKPYFHLCVYTLVRNENTKGASLSVC